MLHSPKKNAGKSSPQGTPRVLELSFALLHSDHAVPGPALTLEEGWPPLATPQTCKNTSELPVPQCKSQEAATHGVMGLGKGSGRALNQAALEKNSLWATLLDWQKIFLCCQSKSWAGAILNIEIEIYCMKIFTSDMNLPWLHRSYTALHVTQARAQPSIHILKKIL